MGEAIGEMLPMAVGVAISPMPIIAVVLMLVTARAKVNGLSFLVGWILGLAAVGGLVLVVAGPTEASEDGDPATWVSWLEIVLGLLLLVLAVKQFRGRPRGGAHPEMPKWMAAIDTFTPPKAAGIAFFLAGLNPKNLLLTVAGAAAISGTGIAGGQQAIALAVFIVIASIGVAAPVVIYFLMGDRAPAMLGELRQWLADHNAVIMSVLLLVIGLKVVGEGLAGL